MVADGKEREECRLALPVLLHEPVGRVLHEVLIVVSPACRFRLGEGTGEVVRAAYLGIAVIGEELVLPLKS